MAKVETTLESPASLSNKKVFEAKERRRLDKAGYSPMKKMAIVKKLRDNSRRLKASKLLKKSRVITDLFFT